MAGRDCWVADERTQMDPLCGCLPGWVLVPVLEMGQTSAETAPLFADYIARISLE